MEKSEVDAQEVIELVTELIRETGQPIVFVREGDEIKIGVLNAQPGQEDWFWLPAPVEQLINQQ